MSEVATTDNNELVLTEQDIAFVAAKVPYPTSLHDALPISGIPGG